MARTDAEILGREDVNDLDAILEITNTDMDEAIHTVENNADSIFTWDYERSRVPLMKLYEKAKTSMWNGETDLDWSIEVDNEKLARENPLTPTVEGIAEFGKLIEVLAYYQDAVIRMLVDEFANHGKLGGAGRREPIPIFVGRRRIRESLLALEVDANLHAHRG
jgi:hypothetical protein